MNTSSRKIFFISGLGANELAFSKLGDIGIEKHFVKWLKNNGAESLESYALRMIKENDITSRDIIAGLSFGGLLAQQISKILGIKNIVLISSFRDYRDLKMPFRMALQMKLNKILLPVKIKSLENIIARNINGNSSVSKDIIARMIRNLDYELLLWSIDKIANSQEIILEETNVYNIQGMNDRIISYWENNNTIKIKGGTHFMIYDQANELTVILRTILSNTSE